MTQTYIVKKGDTLAQIAEMFYGTRNWKPIYEANRKLIGLDTNTIVPDQQLVIPDLYTVQTGDTLTRIAKSYYGNPFDWPRIYRANRDVIGENPRQIIPGQLLVIPY
ncbi:LysM peptidoglycan-binding domain-containing protein [Argonema galeatum]|uniref:LysM peptidoglycan-binding domain-containing protein n=1 Tax=Argonema galeatum TaxID=2942762 RepID=UPI002011B501|nr:LysM peptidoglycan-binding domain-containing protein [Argonema galeatum]MCL1464323.1 LysM peptidoglycan-binding domain-containing protein [Argonema galeatum A003/A1]